MNRNGMRYMWKFFLLLVLVVTSCSEKQIDGNVINVAEAMSTKFVFQHKLYSFGD